jgi:hypothetical protein
VPKAFVVPKDGATAEELMAFVAARVAPYKKVRRVEFVDRIPKSPTGKLLRRVLVERERGVGRGRASRPRADQSVGAWSPGRGVGLGDRKPHLVTALAAWQETLFAITPRQGVVAAGGPSV